MRVQIVGCWLVAISWSSILVAAPFLEGTVTDEQGRPIAGVSVKIWDCIGTCRGGRTVLTDADGHYVFEEKPFRNYPSLVVSMPGRYEISRQHTGPELHEPDTDTPRRADFVLGTPAAATLHLEADVPEGWTQSVVFRSGRDAKVHRYDVEGIHDARWSDWDFQLLPRSESLHLVVVRQPVVVPSDDPKETKERRSESWRNRVEIISPAIRLPDTQRYELTAKVDRDDTSGTSYVLWEVITDAIGTDRTEELALADAMFGPPVEAVARERALALLERVQRTAVPWNALPSKTVSSYEYDFVDAKGERTHVEIDENSPAGPAWSDIARLRGFAYMPPLRWLFSQPDNVVFHSVEVDDERAVLDYRLKSRRGFAAGLAVGPSWNGFFTRGFSAGTILIDVQSGTVLEHRLSNGPLGEESVETFRDYVAVGEGYAPRSLRIQSEDQDFRLSFRVHEDKLWLLDEASHGQQPQPSAKIENVVVTVAD